MKTTSLSGKEIRQIRLDSGLMQRECADIIGVGVRQWQKYEEGDPCKKLYIEVLQREVQIRQNDVTCVV